MNRLNQESQQLQHWEYVKPIRECKPCAAPWEIKAMMDMNKRLEDMQHKFAVKAAMSLSKAKDLYFTC